MQYPKIQTLFKRDEKNIIIPNDYILDEFKELRNIQWESGDCPTGGVKTVPLGEDGKTEFRIIIRVPKE